MSAVYQRLTTHLPERRAAAAGALPSDSRALRAWVDALPMANLAVAAKRLRDGLCELNRQRLDGAQRLDALEILRAPLAQLAAAVDQQVVGASFPLPPQKAEFGELALEFQAELALGYRAALAELTAPSGGVPFLRGKAVTLAAVRALQYGGEHLAKAYLLHRTPPIGAWQALHDVFLFIAGLRLDDRAVVDPLQAGEANARSAYAHALLLALANPYRYGQREQADVVALTRTLAPYAELRERNGDERDVLIHAESDRGPGYLPDERGSGQRDLLALRLDAVLAFVEGQLAMAPRGARTAAFRLRGGPALHVDIELVRRVAASLGARAERGHARIGGGHMLDTVLGLHDLHLALAGGEDFENFTRRVRGQAGGLDAAAPRRGGRTTNLRARVLDQGLGGYRILWERAAGGESVRARVGDLVGLALPEPSDEAAPDWLVGVIRWLRIDEQGRVDAGVELLARRALPVGVRTAVGAEARAPARGVLLAPLDADGGADHSSLLASTEIERGVRQVELTVPADLDGAPRPARTLRAGVVCTLEATGLYQHFALAPAAVDTAEAAALSAGA